MHTTRRAGNDPAGRKAYWNSMSRVEIECPWACLLPLRMPQPAPAGQGKSPGVFRQSGPTIHQVEVIPYQSIGWTDLSVTNLVTRSSKKECWLTSNSLRDTFAFTSPMALPFKKSTDLMLT